MVINATVVIAMEDGLDINYEGGMLVPIEETSSNLESGEEPNDLIGVQVEELFATPDVIPETTTTGDMVEHYEVGGPLKNDDLDQYDSGMVVLDLTVGKINATELADKEPLTEDFPTGVALDLTVRKSTPRNVTEASADIIIASLKYSY